MATTVPRLRNMKHERVMCICVNKYLGRADKWCTTCQGKGTVKIMREIGTVRLHFPKPAKHTRKSIDWHKQRVLARLTPHNDKGYTIAITQKAFGPEPIATLCISIMNKNGKVTVKDYSAKHKTYREHHRVIRALRYLVDEGTIKSNVDTKNGMYNAH